VTSVADASRRIVELGFRGEWISLIVYIPMFIPFPTTKSIEGKPHFFPDIR